MNAWLRSIAALGLSVGAWATDLTITMQHTGKASQGRSTAYWSAAYMRDNHEALRKDQLVDYRAGVVYSIDHAKQKIEKMTFDDMLKAAEAMQAQMAQMKEQMAQLPESMRAMLGGDPGTTTVTEMGKDTVAGRKCTTYKVTMGKLSVILSNDPSLKYPVDPVNFAKFTKFQGMLKGMGPQAGQSSKLYEEMGKLKGMTLKSKTDMPMLGESTSEAISVKEGPIPASVFELPKGYAMEDVGKKMLEQAEKSGRRRH